MYLTNMFSSFCLLTKYEKRLGELGLFIIQMKRQRGSHCSLSLPVGKSMEKTEANHSQKCSAKGHETKVTIALTRQEEEILHGENRSVPEETTQKDWGTSIPVDFQSRWGKPIGNLIRVCN